MDLNVGGFVGWGTHKFDESLVFLVDLDGCLADYAHEFYITDDQSKSDKLHHRMVEQETGEEAFATAFSYEDGEAILTALLTHRKYWLGDNLVELDPERAYSGEVIEPYSEGAFTQQLIRGEALRNLVSIGKLLYIDETQTPVE